MDALVEAGLMDDPRTMLPRLNKLLELALLAPAPPEVGKKGEE